MIWRRAGAEDLTDCLSVSPAHAGAELVGNDRTIEVWRALSRSLSFRSALVEADPPIAGHRTIAFGASVFVSRAIAEEEIANPRPGLNARIIAGVASGQSAVLNRKQLRSANAEGGLDLVILQPQWRTGILNAEQILNVQTQLALAFLDLHAGFRLNRVITETVNEEERRSYLDAQGIWRVVSDFKEFYSRRPDTSWNRDRALAVCTREEAFRIPGGAAAMVFHYREPVLELREADQELLSAALAGSTDGELARGLDVGLPTVKKRWRSLFERASAWPDLFPGMGDGPGDSGRGRQKRQVVLAYVRDHPEELRPF